MTLCLLALSAFVAGAAGLQYSTPEKIEGVSGYHPVLSADGAMLLYTTDDYRGLNLYDFEKSDSRVLSEAENAGFLPVFVDGGKAVMCRRAETISRLRNVAVDKISLTDGKVENMLPLSRQEISVMYDGTATPVVKAGLRSLTARETSTIAVRADYDHITVEQNGKSTAISPVNDSHSYLWATLSPDRTRILFVEPFQGVFTCNLDGSELHRYGTGDYPVWVDNEHFVVVKSSDDGYTVTASRLYLVNAITSSAVALTEPEIMATEAAVAPGRIVFATEQGDIYQISYSIK